MSLRIVLPRGKHGMPMFLSLKDFKSLYIAKWIMNSLLALH